MCLEDTVRIPLYAKGGAIVAYTLIDAADDHFVSQWRWYLHECNGKHYAGRNESAAEVARSARLRLLPCAID